MLVDYAVTEMGCCDDYYDADLRVKAIRGNGITTFLLRVAQFITFHQKQLLHQRLLQRHC